MCCPTVSLSFSLPSISARVASVAVKVLLIEPSSNRVLRVTGIFRFGEAPPNSRKCRSPFKVTPTAMPGIPYCAMTGFTAWSIAARTVASLEFAAKAWRGAFSASVERVEPARRTKCRRLSMVILKCWGRVMR
jgi:hypothetical protein